MYLNFGQLKSSESRMREVINSCRDSTDFRSLVNQAVDSLLIRGDWKGTLGIIYVCVYNGCVTWPRYVDAVRKLNIRDREVRIGNIWHQFVDRSFYSNWLGEDYNNVIRPLQPHERFQEMDALGYYSTFNDVPSVSVIKATSDSPNDIGKNVTIFGKDSNGNPLRTLLKTGQLVDGCTFQIAANGGVTPIAVSPGPIRVEKDETQGNIRLQAVDVGTSNYVDLGFYAPSETTPSYTRYRLHAHRHCFNGENHFPYGVMALVKLKSVPVKCDSDLVLINNVPALKYAVQSIQKSENSNSADAESYMAKAVHELNLQLRNEQPDYQIPVRFRTFGPQRKQQRLGRFY